MNPSTHPYLAIVGSRTYPKLDQVRQFASAAALRGYVIVTGGAAGVDSTAEVFARDLGRTVIVCQPGREGTTGIDFRTLMAARNQLVVDLAHALVAFTERESGGTWDAVRRAQAKVIPVVMFHPLTYPQTSITDPGKAMTCAWLEDVIAELSSWRTA